MTRSPAVIALMISLALNLILIGVFGGLALNRSGPHQRGHNLPSRTSIERGTPDERRLIGDILRQVHKDATAEREAHATARRELFAILSTDPLDMALAKTQLATLRQTEEAMRIRMQTDLLVKMPDLPAQQRARIARRLIAGEQSGRRRERRDR